MKKPANYVDHIAVRDENAVFGVEREAGTTVYDKSNKKSYLLLKPAEKWECLSSFSDKKEMIPKAIMTIQLEALATEFQVTTTKDFTVDGVPVTGGTDIVVSGQTPETDILIVFSGESDSTFRFISTKNTVQSATITNLGQVTSLFGLFSNQTAFASFSCTADFSNITNINNAWDATNITSFPVIDTSNVTTMERAWASTPLTTFPVLDFSSVLIAGDAWNSCQSLTSFSITDFPLVTDLGGAWNNCDAIVDFPALSTPNVEYVNTLFQGCLLLESFGGMDMANSTQHASMFRDCPALVCIGGTIDTLSTLNTGNMFLNCTLLAAPDGATQTSLLAGAVWTNPGACP